MAVVPIASLSPHVTPPPDASIRAVVTLSWPYSSSTQQCALLLADPDFRLRSHHGQIRVQFDGPSAQAIASSRIHIGDEVLLRLGGATWAEAAGITRTPGKSVEGELVYRKHLALSIARVDGESVELDVDGSSPTRSSGKRSEHPVTQTPVRKSMNLARISLGGADGIYPSPAFVKRRRLSAQSMLNAAQELFTDELLDIEPVQKKSRKSWNVDTHWRYAERSPSPLETTSRHYPVSSPQFSPLVQSRDSPRGVEATIIQQIDGAHEDETTAHDREASPYVPQVASMPASGVYGDVSHENPETSLSDVRIDHTTMSISETQQHATRNHAKSFTPAQTLHANHVEVKTTTDAANELESQYQPLGVLPQAQLSPDQELPKVKTQVPLPIQLYPDLEQNTFNAEPDADFNAASYPDPARDVWRSSATEEPKPVNTQSIAWSPRGRNNSTIEMSRASAEARPSDVIATHEAGADDSGHDQLSRLEQVSTESPSATIDRNEAETSALHSIEMTTFSDSVQKRRMTPSGWLPNEWDESTGTPVHALSQSALPFASPRLQPMTSLSGTIQPTPKTVFGSQTVNKQAMVQTFKSLFGFESPERATVHDALGRPEKPDIPGTHTATEESIASPRSPSEPIHSPLNQTVLGSEPIDNLPFDVSMETFFDGSMDIRTDALDSFVEIPSLEPRAEALSPDPQSARYTSEERSPDRGSPIIPGAVEPAPTEDLVPSLQGSPQAEQPSPLIVPVVAEHISADTEASSDPPIERQNLDLEADFTGHMNMSYPHISFSTTQDQTLQRLFGFTSTEHSFAEESERELTQSNLVVDWQSPEVAESQLTEEHSPKILALLSDGHMHDQFAQRNPERGRLDRHSGSDQRTEMEYSEVVEDSFGNDHAQYAGHMSEPDEFRQHSSTTTITESLRHSADVDEARSAADNIVAKVTSIDKHVSHNIEPLMLHDGFRQAVDRSPGLTEATIRLHSTEGAGGLDTPRPTQAGDAGEAVGTEPIESELLPPPVVSILQNSALRTMNATHVQDASVTSLLPPTPEPTQSTMDTHSTQAGSSSHVNDEQKHVDLQHQALPDFRAPVAREQSPVIEKGLPATTIAKTPARRAFTSRISDVPRVLSAWFSPRRSQRNSSSAKTEEETPGQETPDTERPEVQKPKPSFDLSIHGLFQDFTMVTGQNGLTTSHGYYHSLISIEQLLNPSSQQSNGANKVDVLALVTDRSRPAERARSGPRDFFTVLKIHDLSLQSTTDVRVEIFRPWRAKLPEADVGDVILLRDFLVKSKKRQPYLVSTESSAWCVWRYGNPSGPELLKDKRRDKPVWASKVSDGIEGVVKEEIKGPQVEFGTEEREYAKVLRTCWLQMREEHQG